MTKGITSPFWELVKENVIRILHYCHLRAETLERGLDFRVLLREVDKLAVKNGAGKGVADLAFHEFLREKVRETKISKKWME